MRKRYPVNWGLQLGPIDKKNLSERDICTKFITPAVERAGWDLMSQVREEVWFTPVPHQTILTILDSNRRNRLTWHGCKVKDLAKQIHKSPDGMTQTIARAASKRTEDEAFRRELNKLDRALSGATEGR